MTTFTGRCTPAVQCRASHISVWSFQSWLVILDRVEQLNNVLLSGLIHLDHCPLHTCRQKWSINAVNARERKVTSSTRYPSTDVWSEQIQTLHRGKKHTYRSPVCLFLSHGSEFCIPQANLSALQMWWMATTGVVRVEAATIPTSPAGSFSAAITVASTAPPTTTSSSASATASVFRTHTAARNTKWQYLSTPLRASSISISLGLCGATGWTEANTQNETTLTLTFTKDVSNLPNMSIGNNAINQPLAIHAFSSIWCVAHFDVIVRCSLEMKMTSRAVIG